MHQSQFQKFTHMTVLWSRSHIVEKYGFLDAASVAICQACQDYKQQSNVLIETEWSILKLTLIQWSYNMDIALLFWDIFKVLTI